MEITEQEPFLRLVVKKRPAILHILAQGRIKAPWQPLTLLACEVVFHPCVRVDQVGGPGCFSSNAVSPGAVPAQMLPGACFHPMLGTLAKALQHDYYLHRCSALGVLCSLCVF